MPVTTEEVMKRAEDKMKEALASVKKELLTIRTGRASASLLDSIQVDAYGTRSPIKHVANVTTPDARTIVIQPWDKSLLGPVEKAILKSDLGLNPTNDGSILRITIPALTEERRKDLVKVVRKLAEEGKVAVRATRHESNKELKDAEKAGDIPEDDSRHSTEKVQKLTDGYCTKVDEALAAKEKEIMEF